MFLKKKEVILEEMMAENILKLIENNDRIQDFCTMYRKI